MKQKTNRQYPEIIALARKAHEYGQKDDDCLWRIGDKLIDLCGAPGKTGVNNESSKKMLAIADELEQEGLGSRFSLVYLRKLRKTAHAFTPDNRLAGVPWTLHDLAGNPVTLKEMLKNAESKKQHLTASFARDFLAQRKRDDVQKAKEEGKDDANTALNDCVDKAVDAQKLAGNLAKLANDAGTRVASFLPKLTQREDLVQAIESARDDAVKAVEAWEELLKNVTAAVRRLGTEATSP